MKKNKLFFILLTVIMIGIFSVSLSLGAAKVGIKDIVNIIYGKISGNENIFSYLEDSTVYIIWNIRFPRIIVSLFIGGMLSIAGVTYQGILKNPMADPFVLGISSGAALGATIGIISKISFNILGLNFISIMAFAGALLVIFIVYNIARIKNEIPVTTLLLSGIAMSQFLTAILSTIMMLNDRDLNKIFFWTMGSLSGKGWESILNILPYAGLGMIILMYYAKDMDILLLGDESAKNLGVEADRVKKIILVTASVITAASVSVSGIIGFVGLIVPHIVRMFIGPKHIKLLPLSFVTGGGLMVICDTIARSIIAQEIPVGIITAILGGPFFIYILKKKKAEVF
ncbi:MAG TPA: iron ABC transporter [Clostridiales bacterium]|nr:iron ABC transporter [Clostridiales bacterium]